MVLCFRVAGAYPTPCCSVYRLRSSAGIGRTGSVGAFGGCRDIGARFTRHGGTVPPERTLRTMESSPQRDRSEARRADIREEGWHGLLPEAPSGGFSWRRAGTSTLMEGGLSALHVPTPRLLRGTPTLEHVPVAQWGCPKHPGAIGNTWWKRLGSRVRVGQVPCGSWAARRHKSALVSCPKVTSAHRTEIPPREITRRTPHDQEVC